jgi:hypothetical protein
MSVVECVKTVQDVGFPVLIVMYLMFRLNKRFTHLEQTVRNLVNEIREKG